MIKNIIFDFDGVILDSVPVKTEAFRKLFNEYPKEVVDKFIEFHLENGGVSRYEKIKYFFEELLHSSIDSENILQFANKYSVLTKEELANKKYLLKDSVEFIKKSHKKYNMHIASGADENDLRYICDKLDLTQYFLSMNGSPAKKSEIIKSVLISNSYKKYETIMIGDSITDYQAAKENGIEFYGYNNIHLEADHHYINTFVRVSFANQ